MLVVEHSFRSSLALSCDIYALELWIAKKKNVITEKRVIVSYTRNKSIDQPLLLRALWISIVIFLRILRVSFLNKRPKPFSPPSSPALATPVNCAIVQTSQELHCPHFLMIQATLFTPTLDTTTKFVIMTIWLSRNRHLCVTISHKLCKNIVFNTLKEHVFWISVRIASERRF